MYELTREEIVLKINARVYVIETGFFFLTKLK